MKIENIINPNWEKNIEKIMNEQKKCQHQFVTHILQHATRGKIGSRAIGHLTCRKCRKQVKLYTETSHTNEEWDDIEDDELLKSLLPR